MIADYLNSQEDDMASWIRTGVRALKDGDPEKFRRLLTSFLSSIPYTMRRRRYGRLRRRAMPCLTWQTRGDSTASA